MIRPQLASGRGRFLEVSHRVARFAVDHGAQYKRLHFIAGISRIKVRIARNSLAECTLPNMLRFSRT
jgi:hypothetical protein